MAGSSRRRRAPGCEVYRTIGPSLTTTEELRDLTVWFIGAALVALLLALAVVLAWFARLP